MADENETTPAIEGADASSVRATEPKKQRKPRQKKVIAEAAAPVSPAVVKSPRQKRGAQPVDTAATNTPAVTDSKPVGVARMIHSPRQQRFFLQQRRLLTRLAI